MEKKNKTEKAEDFIVSEEENGRITSYILKNKTYLSQVFTKTPCGIILKEHTGMGATSLELGAKRNSIIVEPLKVTASLKANESDEFLYFGSKTNLHSGSKNEVALKKYFEDTSIEYKKIIVVADSLPKVVDFLKRKGVLDTFFLLIDESDSFQLDSSFRPAMELCYQIYKEHSKDGRCMVTATPIEFNDPVLSEVPITIFKYEHEEIRKIDFCYTDTNYLGVCYEKIKEHLDEETEEKIVLALNHIGELLELANTLVDKAGVKKDEIAILCGSNNKDKSGDFYRQIEGDTFPSKVNLITSAYYTGFDIKESYRLIVVVKNKDRLNQLSTNRMKQIVGRCRSPHKISSEEVVYSFKGENSLEKQWTLEELKERANTQLSMLECMQSHLTRCSSLNEHTATIQSHLMNSSDLKLYGFELVTKNKNDEFDVSYLSIDAILDLQKNVLQVYDKKDSLAKRLRAEGHSITEYDRVSSLKISTSSSKRTGKKEVIESLKEKLEECKKHDPYDGFDKSLTESSSNKLEKKALNLFVEFAKYLDNNQLVEKIVSTAEKGNVTSIENLRVKIILSVAKNHPLASALDSQFKVGEIYTTEEKHNKMKFAYESVGMSIVGYKSSRQSHLLSSLYEFKGNRNANEEKGNKRGDRLVSKKELDVDIVKMMEYEPDTFKIFSSKGSNFL